MKNRLYISFKRKPFLLFISSFYLGLLAFYAEPLVLNNLWAQEQNPIAANLEQASDSKLYPSKFWKDFIAFERLNDYTPETEVGAEFLSQNNKAFKLPYYIVPQQDLNLVLQEALSENAAQYFFADSEKKMVRFFVHPESLAFYEPLRKNKNYAFISAENSKFYARATSSTRTLLVWIEETAEKASTKTESKPVFLKLSLAKKQDQLLRIIPGWEVRKSVKISQMFQSDQKLERIRNANQEVFVIPEVAGAYLSKSFDIKADVDAAQKNVFEHGYILRDAEQLEKALKQDEELRPLFSLFARPAKDQKPLIVEIWEDYKKNTQQNAAFEDFLDEFLYKPFLEANRTLFFKEGIIPEIHSQNVLISLQKKPGKTAKITKFFHRDIGSMKVDLRLRWLAGLSVKECRSLDAVGDFKFKRASEVLENIFYIYFHDKAFSDMYLENLTPYLGHYFDDKTKEKWHDRLEQEFQKLFGEKIGKIPTGETSYIPTGKAGPMNQALERFFLKSYPQNLEDAKTEIPELKNLSEQQMALIVQKQKIRAQTMELPSTWINKLMGEQTLKASSNGVLYIEGVNEKRLFLAFFPIAHVKDLGLYFKGLEKQNPCAHLFWEIRTRLEAGLGG